MRMAASSQPSLPLQMAASHVAGTIKVVPASIAERSYLVPSQARLRAHHKVRASSKEKQPCRRQAASPLMDWHLMMTQQPSHGGLLA